MNRINTKMERFSKKDHDFAIAEFNAFADQVDDDSYVGRLTIGNRMNDLDLPLTEPIRHLFSTIARMAAIQHEKLSNMEEE